MIVIRAAGAFDLGDLIALTHQLGYPTSDDTLAENFQRLHANPDAFLYVAQQGEKMAGYFTLHILHWFHTKQPVGRIGALIVDTEFRKHGIGKAMVAYAEQIARAHDCFEMEISSGLRRKATGTYAFYESLGYHDALNDSHYFRKSLG